MSVLETTLQKLSDVEIKKGDANFSDFTELVLEKIRELNEKKTRGRVAKAKDVDPDRVKRPSPASWMFRDENRADIIAEHFDGAKTKGSEVAKKAKEVWDGMTEEERKPWTDRHAELWSAYKVANPGGSAKSSTPSSPFNVESASEVENPDGWNGPHEGKILYKTIPGYTARGVGKFATFAEAVEVANGLDTCGGITFDNKNGYQLRVGSDPNTPPSSTNGEVCWVKDNHVVKNPPKKARRVKNTEESDSDVAATELSLFGSETEDEGDGVETASVVDGADAVVDESAGVVDESAAAEEESAVVVEEHEEDSDSDSDSDDEAMEVVPWDYKGTTYLLDEDSGDVYDYDSQEKIGKKSKSGKLKLDKK